MHNHLVLTGASEAIASYRHHQFASQMLESIDSAPTDYDYIAQKQSSRDALVVSQNGRVCASNPCSRTILSLLEIVPSLTAHETALPMALIEKTSTGFCGISNTGKTTYWDRVVTLDGQVCCKSRADGADWPFDEL